MLAYWDKFLHRPDENEIQEIQSHLNMNGNALRAGRRQYSLPISSTSRQMFGLKRRLVSALWVLSSQRLVV